MSTDLKLEIITTSTNESEVLGKKLGSALRGNELIQLSSDLGGGKTTFTRGMVAGTGSKDIVASPTFTISKLYTAPNFEIYHFDFYRLLDAGIMQHELADATADEQRLVIIEWADIVSDNLPDNRITIEIEPTGDESRKFKMNIPQTMEYIYKALI